VSGDQSRDRTDRALVTPWLKFCWESYRTALDTLKNNARLEVIYQVCGTVVLALLGGSKSIPILSKLQPSRSSSA
jgi:hypothetical protein